MSRSGSATIARRLRRMLLGLLLAAVVCGDAAALPTGQETWPPFPTTPHASPPDDVLVTAHTVAAVDALVASLTRADSGMQVARWKREICPKVLGLTPKQSEFVTTDIAKAARIAGLSVPRRWCRGNVVVVVTNDADGFATTLVRRHPALFRDPSEGLAPRREREAIARSDAPVRWIVASQTQGIGGSASRLQLNSVEVLQTAISIVDATRLAGITWQQLSDYLALASLTHARMDVSYGPNTILSLFQANAAGRTAPPGMTALDKAFLKSLYTSNAALTADAQRLNIRTAIERKLRDAAPDAP